MRRLLTVFMVLCFAVGMTATAAAMKCVGTVVDEEGEPIVGAGVVITHGKALGVTDFDGKFSSMSLTAQSH